MAKSEAEPEAKGAELEATGGGAVDLSPEQQEEMDRLAGETKEQIDIQTDIRIPALSLVQKTSGGVGEARPGELYHTQSGEAVKRAEVVLCRMFKTRTYWGRQDGLGNPPACSSPNAMDGWGDPDEDDMKRDSDDGRTVVPYGQKLTEKGPNGGGRCSSCPKNGIGDNKCQLQYNYFALVTGEGQVVDGQLPVALLMKRTSIKTANNINAMLLEMRYPWSNVMELWGEADKNKAGQEYFVWRAKKGRPATMEEMIAAAKVAGLVSEAQKAGTLKVEGEDAGDGAEAPAGEDTPF